MEDKRISKEYSAWNILIGLIFIVFPVFIIKSGGEHLVHILGTALIYYLMYAKFFSEWVSQRRFLLIGSLIYQNTAALLYFSEYHGLGIALLLLGCVFSFFFSNSFEFYEEDKK